MATIDELRARAELIAEEQQIGGNTAERVGEAFDMVADIIEAVAPGDQQAVLYNPQSPNEAQKAQARENIGAQETISDIADFVKVSAQTFTAAQKQQARENIGAEQEGGAVKNLAGSASDTETLIKAANNPNLQANVHLSGNNIYVNGIAGGIDFDNNGVNIKAGNSGYPNAKVKVNGQEVATKLYVDGKIDDRADPIEVALAAIEAVIPSQASAQNQLADKSFVNSSISSSTANFVGTFNSLSELQAVQNPTNNDYGFVIETDAVGNEYYDRYKYNGQAWLFEYKVESTPFTAAQWAAIQSGITSALVTKLSALPTNADLSTALNAKADKSDTYTKAQVDDAIAAIDVSSQIAGKADKVSNATNGDFAGLDASGNLVDSGKKASDFATMEALEERVTSSVAIVSTLPSTGEAGVIYRVPGTNSYTDYGWNGTQMVALGTFSYGVDTSLAYGSNHLITNDGVVKSDAWKLSSRAAVTFSGDTITIGNGYLYFYRGNIYRGFMTTSATYDLTGSKFLVWTIADNTLSVKSNPAVGDVVLMYHDAVDKWSFGLLMPYWLRSIDKGLDTRLGVVETSMGQFNAKALSDNWGCVCRPKVTFEGNVVTLGVGWMYFYKGNQFSTAYNVTEQTSYTVPNNNFLVFNRTSRTISVVSSLSAGDLVLLEYDPTSTEHWSYGLLNRKYLQYLIENIEIPEPETDEIPAFVKTASFDSFKRMSGVVTYDSFMLAHITDVHSNAANELTKYKQVGYLNSLNKEYGFDALVNNGDIGLDVGETDEQASALMYNTKECMNCTSPWLYVKGNHERTHTDAELASIFVRPTKSQFPQLTYGDSTGIYGHIDYADKQVRVIYINTTDAAVGTHYGISNAQFQWLIATLGSVQNGWRVVVLSHLTPHEIGRWVTESGTQPDQMAFSVNLRAVLSAYVNRRSGSFDSVSYDFTSAQGKLVCILCGDSHFNNYVKDDGVNYIVRQGYGGVSDANLPSGATKDTFNWDAQCLFDVLTINSATSATVFRIGAGGSTRDLTITY